MRRGVGIAERILLLSGIIQHYLLLSGIIRHYPLLSVIIRYYPSTIREKCSNFVPEIEQERSGISRTYKLFVTGPDTVSPFTLRSFSVRSPFILRSFSVRSPFILRSISVLPSFFLRFFSVFERKITENKRKTNGEQTTPKRRRSDLAAILKRTCGNLTFKQRYSKE